VKAKERSVKIENSMKFALLALCVTFPTTNASALDCTVDDPTGTPLNVRSQPNGPIVTVQEVVNLLQYNESHQRAINRNQAQLQDWLNHAPELNDVWTRFISAGGITAEDLPPALEATAAQAVGGTVCGPDAAVAGSAGRGRTATGGTAAMAGASARA
jgi:hypothetical protein